MEFLVIKSQRAKLMVLRTEMEGLKRELNQVWRMHVEGVGAIQHGLHLVVPRHNKFNGSRVAKDVENFMFNIKDHFQATGVEYDMSRLGMICSYL